MQKQRYVVFNLYCNLHLTFIFAVSFDLYFCDIPELFVCLFVFVSLRWFFHSFIQSFVSLLYVVCNYSFAFCY